MKKNVNRDLQNCEERQACKLECSNNCSTQCAGMTFTISVINTKQSHLNVVVLNKRVKISLFGLKNYIELKGNKEDSGWLRKNLLSC